MGRMVRTNVVIDERLVRRVMELYGLKSKRAAIHFALQHAARRDERVKKILALRGIGWDGGDMSESERRGTAHG